MRWCEEHGRGYATPGGLVPIVPAAVIYDLATGDPRRAPGAGGRLRGLRGGGRGGARARAGSAPAPARRSARSPGARARPPAGVGYAAARTGLGHTVAAIAVVNAFGDVIGEDGSVLAGIGAEGGEAPSTAAHDRRDGGGARLAPGRGAQHDARLRDHRRAARQAGLLAGRADGQRRASPARWIRCSPTSTATSPSASPPGRRRAPTASAPWRSGTVAATVTAAAIRDSARA